MLPLSFAADLVGFFADIPSLRDTGWWALLGAAIGSAVAVPAGFYALRDELHHRVHRHMHAGLALLTMILGLILSRGVFYTHARLVPMIYLDLAVRAMALAAFQGWLGGELVYSDGVFVRPHDSAHGESEAENAAMHEGHSHHH